MDSVMDMQTEETRGFKPGAVAAGIILLALGTAMLLDTTGTVDIRFGRMIGPLVLIAIGSTMVLDRRAVIAGYRGACVAGPRRHGHSRRRGGPTSGLWLIGVGAWMLVAQNHLFGLSFHNSWPLFIVLGGVVSVIRGLR
jgi:hypothetical protein